MLIGNKSIDKIIFNNTEITKYYHNSVLFELYKPYINYTWSNTFQADNKMYSKNIGNSGADLQLFSGQGVKFNGTNQTITVPVNATILTEIKRVDGVVVLNTNPQVITDYVIGATSGVHTDYFLFTDALTQQEIELYTNNPNKFFQDTVDGVIDNCVLNMPLHGIDKYQVDYSKYSLGLMNADVTLSNSLAKAPNTITQIDNVFTITDTVAEEYSYEPNVKFYPLIYDTSLYTVKIKVKCLSGTAYLKQFEGTPQIVLNKVLTAGQEYTYESATRFTAIGGQRGALTFDGLNYTNFTVEVTVEIYKVISGINEVINYTADCVTGAKQLPYGSQEASFLHKSSGVPIRTGLSPFFESTPYWGNYGNTGWACPADTDWTIDFIGLFTKKTTEQSHGTAYSTVNNRIAFGCTSLGLLFSRCAGTPVNYSAIDKFETINNMTLVYNSVLKEFKLYLNGVFITSYINSSFVGSITTFHIGSLGVNIYKVDGQVRLFKVHNKVLTQEEITKNFNKYQTNGLLANYLLDENGDYIQDEFGNYIMDI